MGNIDMIANIPDPKPARKPITEARLRANRQNAKSSIGPMTDEGKARSSLNAARG
jgi:hypothetical protein